MSQLPHKGILVTDGGAHPPDMWAEASANEIANIVIIDEQSASEEAKVARRAKPRFALDMADALEDCHAAAQEAEREHLSKKGSDRLEEDHDYHEHCDDAVEKVLGIASKTPFSAEFKREDVMKRVRMIIEADMHTVVDIERSLHVDKNLHSCPKAKAWHAKKHGNGY